ncbi:MAG TPA: response regulator [Kofleriaceae bacterium]|nr:response regulator [Kofleriaceae bacterium]
MLRVLIVDDYPETANILASLVESLGHDCRTAGTGRHALAEALAFEPHVTLLDLGLPDLSGFDVARALRAQPGGATRRIIALTGWATDRDRKLAHQAGCDDFLLKPATSKKLQTLLRVNAKG